MVHVLSVVANHVNSHSDGIALLLPAGVVMASFVLIAFGLAVAVRDAIEAHKNRVARMRAGPVEMWSEWTEWFETAPAEADVAFASNPHGCMTVIRPTFRKDDGLDALFLEVPEFNPEIARTVMAAPRRRVSATA